MNVTEIKYDLTGLADRFADVDPEEILAGLPTSILLNDDDVSNMEGDEMVYFIQSSIENAYDWLVIGFKILDDEGNVVAELAELPLKEQMEELAELKKSLT